MKFELPSLPYQADALSPIISEKTIDFHYGKHHLTYVNNLNNLVTGTRFDGATLETIVKEADGAIFNNAAQVWNHTFYFNTFSPNPKPLPEGELLQSLERDFGSLNDFKVKFSNAAVTLFGSGWAWLVKDAYGNLQIIQESNAGNPLRQGLIPLLTFDVWEHAYYLDYQNLRAKHIEALWQIVDWSVIETRFMQL